MGFLVTIIVEVGHFVVVPSRQFAQLYKYNIVLGQLCNQFSSIQTEIVILLKYPKKEWHVFV